MRKERGIKQPKGSLRGLDSAEMQGLKQARHYLYPFNRSTINRLAWFISPHTANGEHCDDRLGSIQLNPEEV